MSKTREQLTGGFILIGIGMIALISQLVDLSAWSDLGLYFLPALGLCFLVAGIFTRQAGFFVPGGILSGIGWGSFLIEGPLQNSQVDDGGVFMLVFAAGWALITLFSAVFSNKTYWWPLIPGGIMAFIGVAVLFGGVFLQLLTLVGKLWPLALIAVGLYILFKTSQHKTEMTS